MSTNIDERYSHLDDPAERKWLTEVDPMAVLANAHRIYEFMQEGGLPQDSYTRELAFQKASHDLSQEYDLFYNAWLTQSPIVMVSVRIENNYGGDDIITNVTDHVIPAVEGFEDEDEWADEHLRVLTGTGRTEGEAVYDLEITASSNPDLVGRTFAWGY